MLKKMIIVLAFLSLATSAEAAYVRGSTDTGMGTTINASNSMRADEVGRVMNYDDAQYEAEMNTSAGVYVEEPVNDGINYHDKSLHNYQDPYLTNGRAYRSNENGQSAPIPKANEFIILHD